MKPNAFQMSLEALRFVEAQPNHLQGPIMALRNAIIGTVPHATEKRVWNALSFYNKARGGPVKGAICQIEAINGCLRLAFIQGTAIKDNHGLLKGDGVAKRYLLIDRTDSSFLKDIMRLIKQADSSE
jgi:hypothetical protein